METFATCHFCGDPDHTGRRCRAHRPVLFCGRPVVPPLPPVDSYTECGCVATLSGTVGRVPPPLAVQRLMARYDA